MRKERRPFALEALAEEADTDHDAVPKAEQRVRSLALKTSLAATDKCIVSDLPADLHRPTTFSRPWDDSVVRAWFASGLHFVRALRTANCRWTVFLAAPGGHCLRWRQTELETTVDVRGCSGSDSVERRRVEVVVSMYLILPAIGAFLQATADDQSCFGMPEVCEMTARVRGQGPRRFLSWRVLACPFQRSPSAFARPSACSPQIAHGQGSASQSSSSSSSLGGRSISFWHSRQTWQRCQSRIRSLYCQLTYRVVRIRTGDLAVGECCACLDYATE